MYLRELGIKNYRSLEDVRLERISKLNILIGQNNSGKSAVIGAIDLLNKISRGAEVEWSGVLTAKDQQRALEMRLLFELSAGDREEFINMLCGAGQTEGRRESMLNSALARQLEFWFKSPAGAPQLLHLRETRLMAEDGQWATIQKLRVDEDERMGNPASRMTQIATEAARSPSEPLHIGRLNSDSTPSGTEFRLQPNYLQQGEFHPDRGLRWPLVKLGQYLGSAFFFNPFRHSTARLPAQQTEQLAQDGSNLSQVLHTINSNDRELFSKIEEFVQAALPDVGRLQTPLFTNSTEVHFKAPEGYMARLHDMGGGIEQLLMIATVLLTTSEAHTLFVEEPESHLHAGAQRFLMERLYHGDRQVFVTTHSPTFVNSPRPKSIYQVQYQKNRTKISRLGDADSLSDLLADIGSRNSDVLLSDAVLFVEGSGDRRAFAAWSDTLGMSMEENNITVLTMGGSERAGRDAPVRSDVLTGISKRAGVPHLFVFDRDERSEAEVEKVEAALGDRVHFLRMRELENYLLAPRAILEALKRKYRDDVTILERIEGVTEGEVGEVIREAAEGLYGLVLLKRIRVALGGLIGGFLPRDITNVLAPAAKERRLAELIRQHIDKRLQRSIGEFDIDKVVAEERARLDAQWEDPGSHVWLAPGEEILTAVFRRVGGEYAKPEDTERIAREMIADEISPELKEVIKRVIATAH